MRQSVAKTASLLGLVLSVSLCLAEPKPIHASPGNPAIGHPGFFSGEASLGQNWYYLGFASGQVFGYYNYDFFPYLYHDDLGFEYVVDAGNAANGMYMYDFIFPAWLYTDRVVSPFCTTSPPADGTSTSATLAFPVTTRATRASSKI
ncbi:MAG TPA: hypothetical protein VEF03_04255 [Candidatus Binataceae bacterium]|nr:hypothetical protein [Candidatus Binataceae bacterium]